MKKILVTGGAGFIGSHLCDRLLAEGHFVYCLDDLQTGSLDNIEHLFDHRYFLYVHGDVCNPVPIELNEHQFDEIYNLACPASPPHYQKDAIKTMQTCVQGAINVLDFAKQCGAKVFQASTSEVYGDPLEHPQKETYLGNVSPNGPRSCYDEGKRAAESVFFTYNRDHGVDIRVGRIFNTYGPRMDRNDGRVVSNFVVSALCGAPLRIYGRGDQTRSFCYVSDLVDGILRIMESPFDGPVNLGNPQEFTVSQLANIVLAMVETESEVEFCELPKDDPTRRKPDITKAIKLGFLPRIDLNVGLLETVNYFAEKCGLRAEITQQLPQ